MTEQTSGSSVQQLLGVSPDEYRKFPNYFETELIRQPHDLLLLIHVARKALKLVQHIDGLESKTRDSLKFYIHRVGGYPALLGMYAMGFKLKFSDNPNDLRTIIEAWKTGYLYKHTREQFLADQALGENSKYRDWHVDDKGGYLYRRYSSKLKPKVSPPDIPPLPFALLPAAEDKSQRERDEFYRNSITTLRESDGIHNLFCGRGYGSGEIERVPGDNSPGRQVWCSYTGTRNPELTFHAQYQNELWYKAALAMANKGSFMPSTDKIPGIIPGAPIPLKFIAYESYGILACTAPNYPDVRHELVLENHLPGGGSDSEGDGFLLPDGHIVMPERLIELCGMRIGERPAMAGLLSSFAIINQGRQSEYDALQNELFGKLNDPGFHVEHQRVIEQSGWPPALVP